MSIDFSKPCESFEQACAEVVDVSLTQYARDSRYTQECKLSDFQGTLPFVPRWTDWLWGTDATFFNYRDTETAIDLLVPYLKGESIDVSLCTSLVDDRARENIRFVRVRKRNAVALRGKMYFLNGHSAYRRARVTPPLFEVSDFGIYDTDRCFSCREFIGFHNDHLALASKSMLGRRGPVPAAGSIYNKDLFIATSIAFTIRYEWQVRFGLEGGLSMSYPSDRESIGEVFRLRDVPEGRHRRSAILQLITQHWKRSRSQAPTEDPQVFVREHLRGQTKFSWNGLTCEVIPPKYDVERISEHVKAT